LNALSASAQTPHYAQKSAEPKPADGRAFLSHHLPHHAVFCAGAPAERHGASTGFGYRRLRELRSLIKEETKPYEGSAVSLSSNCKPFYSALF